MLWAMARIAPSWVLIPQAILLTALAWYSVVAYRGRVLEIEVKPEGLEIHYANGKTASRAFDRISGIVHYGVLDALSIYFEPDGDDLSVRIPYGFGCTRPLYLAFRDHGFPIYERSYGGGTEDRRRRVSNS
jgi:hypothetical protein